MLKPINNYRHYIICNMPMNFLLFLIENNALNSFVNNVIIYHTEQKSNPAETVRFVFKHEILHYIFLAFTWSCTAEGFDYWNNLERKWYKLINNTKLKS